MLTYYQHRYSGSRPCATALKLLIPVPGYSGRSTIRQRRWYNSTTQHVGLGGTGRPRARVSHVVNNSRSVSLLTLIPCPAPRY